MAVGTLLVAKAEQALHWKVAKDIQEEALSSCTHTTAL